MKMAVVNKKVTSMKTAQNALMTFLAKRAELDRLKAEHGISELENELVEIKKRVTDWAAENDVDRIDLGDAGHATLIRGVYGGHYVGTAEDVTGDEGRVVTPLRTIIYRKYKNDSDKAKRMWFAVTKRLPDPESIDRMVKSGQLTV